MVGSEVTTTPQRTTRTTSNNQTKKDIPVMEQVDIEALADRCLKLLKESQNENHQAADGCTGFNCYQQIFIGIAGGPGSGKSTIAEQVRDLINQRNPNGDKSRHECAVVGMDGYHLSRHQLKEKVDAGDLFKTDQVAEDGKPVWKKFTFEEVMARRGAAFTFDPQGFINDLQKIRETGEGSMPVYSREKHDPVPDENFVTQDNKIILVEGLYLLCFDDPNWKPLGDLWDDKWYIDVSAEETKKRLVKRHLKTWDDAKTKQWGGNDEAAAARKAEANDLKNARCIEKNSKNNANLIIRNEGVPEDDTNNADTEAAT